MELRTDEFRCIDVVSAEGTRPNLLERAAAGGLDLLTVEDGEVHVDLDDALGDAGDSVVLTSEYDGR